MPNVITNLFWRIKNFIFPHAAAQQVFDVTPATSQTMEQNINLWYAMYIDQPPWANKEVVPLGLPAAICRELSRTVMVEFSANIEGGARAEYLGESFQAAMENFVWQIEIGLATGGIALKPYKYGDKLLVDATSAAAFEPTKFDPTGRCISGVFREKTKYNGRYYTRLEYHELSGTQYTVRNKAFRSDSSGGISNEVSLVEVPDWAEISPETIIQNVDGPLFSYFRVPKANNIDTESRVGASVYGGATVDLIRRADEQWDLIRWEYKSGQRKIFLDAAETTARQFDKRLFECAPFSADGNFFQQFEPSFRDEPLYRGLQSILRQIEFHVGLSYGVISDPQETEKTATEIRSSKQRMYVTVDSIQKALQHTFDGLIYAMDVYATLYGLSAPGDYTVTYDWGDSVLNDADEKERERANDRQDLANGTFNDWEYRVKWRKEDEETAKKMLPKMEDMTTEKEEEIE